MIVVADTSPICYLTLIGHLDTLPSLFGRVLVPPAVRDELGDQGAPQPVRTLIEQMPDWLEVRPLPSHAGAPLGHLHAGEREAILLALALAADLIILDEKAARQAATDLGLRVTGLLGILDEAAVRGLLDLPEAVDRLRQTTFRASPQLLRSLLNRHRDA